jgi:hypothetical protein
MRVRFIKYIEERANKRQSVLELVKNQKFGLPGIEESMSSGNFSPKFISTEKKLFNHLENAVIDSYSG